MQKKIKVFHYLVEAPNRSLPIINPTSATFDVNRNIRDHARFGDFEISRLLIVDKNQSRARRALTVQQPDVGGDVKPTAQSLD